MVGAKAIWSTFKEKLEEMGRKMRHCEYNKIFKGIFQKTE